jgi:hypothetical protein
MGAKEALQLHVLVNECPILGPDRMLIVLLCLVRLIAAIVRKLEWIRTMYTIAENTGQDE